MATDSLRVTTDVDDQSNSDPTEVENFDQSEYTNKENKLTNEIETKAYKRSTFKKRRKVYRKRGLPLKERRGE